MKEFADCFRNIKGIKNHNNDSSLNPVTVALIDDGVDIGHTDLRGDKFLGKSFDPFGEDSWRINPFWVSAVGHGTLMARLIRHICPSAVIYIIKLETFESDGKLRIRQQSVIEVRCSAREPHCIRQFTVLLGNRACNRAGSSDNLYVMDSQSSLRHHRIR